MWKTKGSQLSTVTPSDNSVQWNLSATHEVQYKIFFQNGIFDCDNKLLASCFEISKRVLLLIDRNVYKLYNQPIIKYFQYYGIEVTTVLLDAGEENKSIDMYQSIIDRIISFKPLRRQEPILAVGGGVLTDAVCFAAATYKRGIPVLRIPTTLMGMIDAAVGVKCAINYKSKNLLGSYHASRETFIDPIFLKTLTKSHIRNGIAEIIKIAIACSKTLFELCEKYIIQLFENLEHEQIFPIISLSIELMLKELGSNLYEYNLERAVDFGHTWSPELEISSNPLLHGYAVNVDMAYSISVSEAYGLLSEDEVDRIFNLMHLVDLPVEHPLMHDKSFIRNTILSVKRHRDGELNLPLPKSIGSTVFLKECYNDVLDKAHELYCARINKEVYDIA